MLLPLLSACVAPPVPQVRADLLTDRGALSAESVSPDPLAAAPRRAVSLPAGTPAVLVNEVQTRNDSTVMDVDNTFPDWFELVNVGDAAVPLANLTLTGDNGAWVGGDGVLEPGATLLVLSPFALDAGGDHLDLYADGTRTDGLATGEMAGDTAWARFPDGSDWALTGRATPGWSNGSRPAPADPSDVFFTIEDADDINDLWVGLSETSYASLEDSPYVEVPASLAFEGAWFPDVSARRKGVYGSLRSMSQKVALKLDLNQYTDHHLRGLETLSINNMVQDVTYVHEALAYLVWRSCGVPASRTGYTRMYINDEYYGLYVHVETVDDTFLSRWYSHTDGNLYEGAYGVDFYDGYEFYFECDECTNPDDRSDITAVTNILNRRPAPAAWADLQEVVDMDELLTYMAVEAMLWHWDGYTTSNNYRVYHDPKSGKFQMFPWGSDQTWVDEWYGPFDAGGRIFSWCMQESDCLDLYLDKMEAVADVMDSLDMQRRMADLLDILDTDIQGDPRKEWDTGTRNSYLRATTQTIDTTAQRMRDEAASRR